jgi:hypothetical protein
MRRGEFLGIIVPFMYSTLPAGNVWDASTMPLTDAWEITENSNVRKTRTISRAAVLPKSIP